MLRLIYAVLCFATSLLAIVPAPTHFAWELSVLVTEFGWILALASLFALLPGWRATRNGRIAAGIAIVAFLIALTPIVRARSVASTLPGALNDRFGNSTSEIVGANIGRSTPFSFADLVRGVPVPNVQVRTLSYAHRITGDLQLGLYTQPHTQPLPIVLVIHGGSWQSGDRTQLAPLNKYLAAHRYAVAAMSYRFAPQHPFPAPLDDAHEALAYLKTNAQTLGLDASRIAIIGRSAGGQLALLAAYIAHDPSIRGAISFYGPTDMVWGYEHPSRKPVMDSRKILEDYLAGTPTSAPNTYTAASPLHFASDRVPPTLMIHGIRDELVSIENSRRLDRALTSTHVPHLLIELPWATHGCDYNFSGPCGQLSTYAIERFLAHVMR